MIDMKRTGERIQQACERRGISVRLIQEELNVGAFQSIYNWFNGKALPTLENYHGLCRLLHIPMESLIVLKGSSVGGMESISDRTDWNRLMICGEADIPVQMEHYAADRLESESSNRLREYETILRKGGAIMRD